MSSGGARTFFANMTAGQKRAATLGGLTLALILVFLGLRSTGIGSSQRAPVSADNLLTSADSRALGLASLNSEISKLRSESRDMEAKHDALTQKYEALRHRQEEYEKEAAQRPAASSTPTQGEQLPEGELVRPLGVVPGVTGITQSAAPAGRFADRQAQIDALRGTERNRGSANSIPIKPENRPAPAILTIGAPTAADTPQPAVAVAPIEESETDSGVFLPAGTLITTLLLNGMDAPTGRSAQQQPLPVLARVKTDANMPNRFMADIRECRLIGSAWGDLSSERAYIRAETLSCIRSNGGAIEVKLKAFATGEDGKFGLRGPVVEKRGQMIGRAALAGFLGAAADALQPQRIPVISTSGGSEATYQQNDGAGAAKAATYGGVSGAADRLADYYIKRADELVPVIEISAGREVTFVVQEGKSLDLRSAAR